MICFVCDAESLPGSMLGTIRLHTKLLVSNSAAGSIIGKNGSNINLTQSQTQAKIQLSKAMEYFPGTKDRTLLVSGTLRQIIAGLYAIFVRLIKEDVAPIVVKRNKDDLSDENEDLGSHEVDWDSSQKVKLFVKMLVPQDLCGIIVGKSGSTIKHCSDVSKATVRISPVQYGGMELTHKIVCINGELTNIMKAIAMVILKQAEDPNFRSYGSIPVSYYVRGEKSEPYLESTRAAQYSQGIVPFAPAMPGFSSYHLLAYTSVVYPLSEEQRLVLYANNREGMSEVERIARVQTSLEEGPTPDVTLLRVYGTVEGVTCAHALMSQKLASHYQPIENPWSRSNLPRSNHM